MFLKFEIERREDIWGLCVKRKKTEIKRSIEKKKVKNALQEE